MASALINQWEHGSRWLGKLSVEAFLVTIFCLIHIFFGNHGKILLMLISNPNMYLFIYSCLLLINVYSANGPETGMGISPAEMIKTHLLLRDLTVSRRRGKTCCDFMQQSPRYLRGIHSKTPRGSLKPWRIPNPIYSMFFPIHTYL